MFNSVIVSQEVEFHLVTLYGNSNPATQRNKQFGLYFDLLGLGEPEDLHIHAMRL